MLQSQPLGPPVELIDRPYQWKQETLGQVGVESELVHLIVADHPAPQHIQELANAFGVEGTNPIRGGRRLVNGAEPVLPSGVPARLAGGGERAAPTRLVSSSVEGDDLGHDLRYLPARSCCFRRRKS